MKFILQTTRKIGFLSFILGVCLFTAQTAFSQVSTWDGGGDNSTWSDATNWSGDVAPVSTDSVIIIAGANVSVTAGTAVCRKLGIYGSGTNQGKVTVNVGATLNVSAAATGNVNPTHSVISLFGGMIDNKGTMTVSGRTNIDAIRFDNPTSGTLSSTYMGTGALTINTATGQGSGSTAPSGGNNGTAMTFAQTSGTATFTVGGTYSFTLGAAGSKSAFYCPKGSAKIDGTGTITISGVWRSIRVIPIALNETPNFTIESGVTMNLSTAVTTADIGIVLLDYSTFAGTTTVNMTNKGILNFSGDVNHPIYMNNPSTATSTTNFMNEGTININGTFSTVTTNPGPPVTTVANNTGGIIMAAASANANTTSGNKFTNSGFINFNTTVAGTSTKPLFLCGITPKNLIENSGTITVGTNGAPAIALRLGDTKTTLNNTGTITVGAGSITGGGVGVNAIFNNNTGGILNFNSGVASTLVAYTNGGGTFNFPVSQNVGRLTVNGGTVTVADGTTLTTFLLTLTSGNVSLGTGNLVISSGGSIADGGSGSYIVTNGTGALKISNFTGSKTFPVGTASAYAPVIIDNTVSARDFSVKVGTTFSGAPAVPNKMVQLQWDITPSDLTSNNAALTFQWPATANGSSFNAAAAIEIRHYTGSWSEFKLATVSGSGPYTASAHVHQHKFNIYVNS